jgi:hypothetical protein
VAGSPGVFPELQSEEGLAPWAALKLYRSARFDTTATTLTLDGAKVDVAAGKTFHQIAMASRSLHRSQDMGQLQTIGPSVVRLSLMKDATGAGAFGLWGGVDTTMGGVPTSAGSTRIRSYRALIDSCRANLGDSAMAKPPR